MLTTRQALGTDRDYDFAVVALDRAVEIGGVPRTPLSIGSVGVPQLGEDLILVGHPSGTVLHHVCLNY